MQLILVCYSSRKYSRMLMKIKEELCGKVSKLVVVLFCLLIGEMLLKRIFKGKIGLRLLKDNNGRKDNYDSLKIRQIKIMLNIDININMKY